MAAEVISRYRLGRKLGGGGMGLVYEAEDLRLGRTIALKFLPADLADDSAALERLHREASAASALNHPNICTIYDIDQDDGRHFITMELMEGQTLAEKIAAKPLPTDYLLDVAVQIADALTAAHAKGIIHRDLKPSNIFVTERGQAKLLDFGLAKILPRAQAAAADGGETSLTSIGETPGTLVYMSPEQVLGKPLDMRSDLFSVGVVLYEMATGQLPFRGASSGEVCDAILHTTPPAPVRLNADVPVELEQIISKALDKDRELRYQHASEIRADLQRLKRDIESTKIVATHTSAKKTFKHRKLGVVVAACIAAIGLAAVGTWYLRSSSTAQIDSIAVLPLANGGGDANYDYLSDGITESLIYNLVHVPQLKVKSRNSVFRYKGKDVDAHKVGNDLGVSALVSGRVVPRGDSIEVSVELTDVRDNTAIWGRRYSGRNTEMISLQQQIAGDIAEKLHSKLSTSERQQVTKQGTQNLEAYELYLKGRYSWNKRTPPDMATAISYFNQAIAKDPSYALAYSGLADAYSLLAVYGGNPSEAYLKSTAAARRAMELDDTLARPHAVLGRNEMWYDWDFAGGVAEHKKALELDPSDSTAHQWYAEDIAMIGGREQEALAEITRAHQLDPLSSIISAQVGWVHFYARRYDEAIVVGKKLANEQPTFAIVHRLLALAYLGKRMYPQVIEEWTAYGRLSGDRNDAAFASALEQGFRSGGWKGAAKKAIETGQAQRKTGYFSAFRIAVFYADLGEKDEAFRWLNTAYQERDWLLVWLNTTYLVDPLRSDPRFAELVRKVGLPQ